MDSQLIAEKAEAVNRLTGAVHQGALEYWSKRYEADIEGWRTPPDKTEWIIWKMLKCDAEVVGEIKDLLRIIIEEKTPLDQK